MKRWIVGVWFAAALVGGLASGDALRAATPDQFFDRGVRAYGRAKWQEAADAFAAFVNSAPQDRRLEDALFFRAESLLQTGDAAAADKLFGQLESRRPPGKWTLAARFRRGERALAEQRLDDARAALEDCLARSKDKQHVGYSLVYLAELALAAGQWERFTELDEALKRRERLPEPLVKRYERMAVRAAIAQFAAADRRDEAANAALAAAAQRLADRSRFAAAEDAYLRANLRLQREEYVAAWEELETLELRDLSEHDASELAPLKVAALLGLRRHEEAARLLRTLVELRSERPLPLLWREQLTGCLSALARWEEAAWWWEWDDVYEDEDAAAQTRLQHGLKLADAAYGAARWEVAVRLYQQLADDARGDERLQSTALAGLAWSARKLGRRAEARDAFQRWLSLHPQDARRTSIALGLAEVLMELGDERAALEAYRRVASVEPATPETPAALLAVARLQRQTQSREAAEATLRQLIDAFPQFRQLDEALYEQAWLLLDLERREEAQRCWRRIVAEFPANPLSADARYRLACEAQRRGQFDEARRWLAELAAQGAAAELAEHALHLEARILASEGKWEELEGRMTPLAASATRTDTRLAAEYWLAEGAFRQEKWSIAAARLAALETALASQPPSDRASPLAGANRSADDDLWRIQVSRRRAETLAKLGEWTSALQVAETVQSRHPGFRWNYEMDFVRGQCLAALGRASEARSAWQAVVQSSTGGRTETAAAAQWQIGQSWELAENWQAAIAAYEAVERLYPESDWRTRATLARGYCLERTGDWKAAIRCFADVIREQGSNTWSKEAEAGLRRTRQAAFERSAPRSLGSRR
ncbi:MAG: tetratricopeptide repeat protein [Pirellulales bacterium]